MGEILIIDDDPDVLSATVGFLTTKGYSAVPEQDPENGLKLIKENPHRFDLILLDWRLKSPIDGDTFIDLLHHTFPHFNIPIIVVTGHSSISSKYFLKLGAFDTVKKASSSAELFDAIERALKKRPPEAPHLKAPTEFPAELLLKKERAREILSCLRKTGSIAGTARELACHETTIRRQLEELGILPFLIHKERQPFRKGSQ